MIYLAASQKATLILYIHFFFLSSDIILFKYLFFLWLFIEFLYAVEYFWAGRDAFLAWEFVIQICYFLSTTFNLFIVPSELDACKCSCILQWNGPQTNTKHILIHIFFFSIIYSQLHLFLFFFFSIKIVFIISIF